MHLIVYFSDYTGDETTIAKDLEHIKTMSQSNNKEEGITGVLFYQNGNFMQFLEGEEADIRKKFAKISQDSRHTNIRVLFDEPIEKRYLKDSRMDTFNLSKNETIDYAKLERIKSIYTHNLQIKSNTLIQAFKTFLEESTLFL